MTNTDLFKGMKPCPFCGAGESLYYESRQWTGMRDVILAVKIHHWCEREEGRPQTFLQVAGKTRKDVNRIWNRRQV